MIYLRQFRDAWSPDLLYGRDWSFASGSFMILRSLKPSGRLSYGFFSIAIHHWAFQISHGFSICLTPTRNTIKIASRSRKGVEYVNRKTLKFSPTGSVYEFVGGLYGDGREDDSQVTASHFWSCLPQMLCSSVSYLMNCRCGPMRWQT